MGCGGDEDILQLGFPDRATFSIDTDFDFGFGFDFDFDFDTDFDFDFGFGFGFDFDFGFGFGFGGVLPESLAWLDGEVSPGDRRGGKGSSPAPHFGVCWLGDGR